MQETHRHQHLPFLEVRHQLEPPLAAQSWKPVAWPGLPKKWLGSLARWLRAKPVATLDGMDYALVIRLEEKVNIGETFVNGEE